MSGILKYEVGTLSADFDATVEEVLDQGAHLVVGLAKIYVHVDTGSLRDSIRVERGGEGLHWRQFSVRAGGYVVNPKTGRFVDYAGIVEEKYPFLWPALEEVAPQLMGLMVTELSKLQGVDDVSIEGNEAVIRLRADTTEATSNVYKLESAATRAARIVRRLTGDENIDGMTMKVSRAITTLRSFEYALYAVQVAEGPIGWLFAGISVASAAITVGDLMYDQQRGF